jgi:hypothetical protein
MPTTYLTLTDLENRISDLERRYGVPTYEMLKDEPVRSRISEDVLLRWETYVRQRAYLIETYAQTHSEYLAQVRQSSKPRKSSEPQMDQLAVAA